MLGVAYLLAVLAFIVTGRVALNIHGVLWPSLGRNTAAHMMLGGFVGQAPSSSGGSPSPLSPANQASATTVSLR